jgi:hypothetical protein
LTEDWQSPDEIYNLGPTEVPVSLVKGSAVKEPETMIDERSEASKERGAKRLLRALKKIACDDLRGRRRHEKRTKYDYVYRAFITIEDEVGIKHQSTGRVPDDDRQATRTEEIADPKSQAERTREKETGRTRLPKLLQSLEDGVELILKTEGRGRRRPDAPGTSKPKHFAWEIQRRTEEISRGLEQRGGSSK